MKTDIKETPPRAVRLKTSNDCRRLLARIVNSQIRGEIEDGSARTTAYLIQVLLKAISDNEVESRLEEVEAALVKLNSNRWGTA